MYLSISDNDVVFLVPDEDSPKEYYGSKLCFLDDGVNHNRKMICICEGNALDYDPVQDVYILPHGIDNFQYCFLLRLIIDTEQVKRGNLPLHAAAVSNGSHIFIIAAPSGRGKSFISDTICSMFPDYKVIGDDHIILTSTHIQGNIERRIRDKNGKHIGYVANSGLCKICPITWVCMSQKENDLSPVFLSQEEALNKFAEASAFKYLNEIFVHNDIRYPASVLADYEINQLYQSNFYTFLNRDSVLFLCGTPLNAVHVISDLIRKGEIQ